MLRNSTLFLVIASMLSLAGCDEPIVRLGYDVEVTAQWTIDGAAPTAASCAALGVSTVRVELREVGSSIWGFHYDNDCAAGSGMDVLLLPETTYEVSLIGLDSAGAQVTDRAVNPEQTVVDRETSVSIEGNFTTPETLAAVSANWTVGGQPASAATCGDVASIEFSFTNGTDTVTFEAPCASGSVTSDPALGEGTWTGTVTLLDAAGNAIGETTTVEAFTVAAGNTSVTLGAIAFPAQTNPIIHVTFRYETGVDTDTYGTCASEQVTQNYMFYLLDADENEPSFFTPPTACVDSLDIEVPDALAQYSIEISGRSADGTVKWGGEPCSGLQGDESVTFECDIEAVP